MECSSDAVRTACDIQVDGKWGLGSCAWKLMTVDLQERSTWRLAVRSAMCAASQLPGSRPTDVDNAPAPAC